MHVLIDNECKSYNVKLRIENNKLIATWDGEDAEVNLSDGSTTIIIEE